MVPTSRSFVLTDQPQWPEVLVGALDLVWVPSTLTFLGSRRVRATSGDCKIDVLKSTGGVCRLVHPPRRTSGVVPWRTWTYLESTKPHDPSTSLSFEARGWETPRCSTGLVDIEHDRRSGPLLPRPWPITRVLSGVVVTVSWLYVILVHRGIDTQGGFWGPDRQG